MDINLRERFNKGPHRAKFHDAIATDWLQDAIVAASVEMIDSLPVANDQFTAMANSLRIDGARKFVERFCSLTEQAQPRKIETKANLEHNI